MGAVVLLLDEGGSRFAAGYADIYAAFGIVYAHTVHTFFSAPDSERLERAEV